MNPRWQFAALGFFIPKWIGHSATKRSPEMQSDYSELAAFLDVWDRGLWMGSGWNPQENSVTN